jgi:hypothetical protein
MFAAVTETGLNTLRLHVRFVRVKELALAAIRYFLVPYAEFALRPRVGRRWINWVTEDRWLSMWINDSLGIKLNAINRLMKQHRDPFLDVFVSTQDAIRQAYYTTSRVSPCYPCEETAITAKDVRAPFKCFLSFRRELISMCLRPDQILPASHLRTNYII